VLSTLESAGKRIDALNHGASDHIIKPFERAELVARVRALLRRQPRRPAPDATGGELQLDPIRHAARVNGTEISMSAKEFQLLQALAHTPGAVLSRAELEDRIYGWQGEVGSNAVEVHIHNLRKKLGAGTIQNVRGVGYRIASSILAVEA
jgi:two-component system response regulator QseB